MPVPHYAPIPTRKRGLISWLRSTGQFPNFLTLLRVILSWVPGLLIIQRKPRIAATVFGLIVATDAIDGKLARNWNQVSKFGQLCDPAADKALTGLTLLALCKTRALKAPWLQAFTSFTLAREAFVSAVRWHKARGKRNLVIPANRDGKLKMVALSGGIITAILGLLAKPFRGAAWVAFAVSVIFSVKSAVAYIKA